MFVVQTARNPQLDAGIWTNYRGAKFLIGHTSNPKFQREISRLQQPFRKDIEKGRMDPEEMKDIVCEALSKHVLLGWDDVKDAEGVNMPFSQKMAKMALMNDEGFREFVQEFSTELANFRQAEIEEKGNS